MKLSRNSQVLILFFIVAIALRFYSFFSSVLDHDESTYLIIGRDLLHGKSLYVDVTDSKPAGIFLIYAFMQLLFGYSIFLKRVFVSALVGVTAYLLSRVSLKMFKDNRIAIASGFIYIFLSSSWKYFGVSPNTELFFNFFTVSSLLFFFRKSNLSYLLAGLLLGIGFIIKYLVLLDFMAFFSFFFLKEIFLDKEKFKFSYFSHYLFAGIGFAIPFLSVNLYFYLNNHFEAFRFITYELPQQYREHTTLWQFVKLLLDFTGRFFPVTFLMFYALLLNKSKLKNWPRYFLIYWMVAVLVAIYLPGKGYSHYAIQLMLPVSLIAGVAFDRNFALDRISRFFYRGKSGVVFLVLLICIMQFFAISGKIRKIDKERVVANYLKTEMSPDDQVFVANYEQILYYLLHKECPTKYVHSTILSLPDLASAFNVDPKKEIERILAERPKYVVIKKQFKLVQDEIKTSYSLDKTFFNDLVFVYKRKD